MKEEREISYEMAEDMGLIPRPTDRYCFMLPFESRYGFDRRMEEAEAGHRAESARLREKYKHVFLRGEKLKVV